MADLTGCAMSYLDFSLLHYFLTQSPLSRGKAGEFPNRALTLLECLYEIVADENYGGRLADALAELLGDSTVQVTRSRIDSTEPLSLDDWLVLSYGSAIHEMISNGWERSFQPIVQSGHTPARVKLALEQIRTLFQWIPFSPLLDRLHAEWEPGKAEVHDALALFFILNAALVRVLGSPILYSKVASLLRAASPFIVVYLASTCIKLEDVFQSLLHHAALSKDQYSCLRLLYCFHTLPGVECG